MKKASRRALCVTGAVAAAAGLLLASSPAALADGEYYGTWTLTAWKLNGTEMDSPGKLPVPPPAPSIEYAGGEQLQLKENYRCRTTIPAFKAQKGKGDFEVITSPNRQHKAVIFDSDDRQDDPRAYKMRLEGSGAQGPTKMVICQSVGSEQGLTTIEMIFVRAVQ